MMRRIFVSAMFLIALPAWAAAEDPKPEVIPLWANGAPGFESRKDEKEVRTVQKSGEYKVTNIHNPSLTVFLPPREKATGAAVVIAPGGGHRELWVLHEGENVARWLSSTASRRLSSGTAWPARAARPTSSMSTPFRTASGPSGWCAAGPRTGGSTPPASA